MSEETKLFTREELKCRNSRDDAILIIHNGVYDVTKFLDELVELVAGAAGAGRGRDGALSVPVPVVSHSACIAPCRGPVQRAVPRPRAAPPCRDPVQCRGPVQRRRAATPCSAAAPCSDPVQRRHAATPCSAAAPVQRYAAVRDMTL